MFLAPVLLHLQLRLHTTAVGESTASMSLLLSSNGHFGHHICSSVKFFTMSWCIRAQFISVVCIVSKCDCVCYGLKLFFPMVSPYCSPLSAPKSQSGFRKVCSPERLQCVLGLGMNLRGTQLFTVASSMCQGYQQPLRKTLVYMIL